MNIVLFERDELEKPLAPRDERAKHILKVLHKGVGDTFEAGVINGDAGQAEITGIDASGISFSFTPLSDGKPLFPVTLIVGFPRPIQLKRLFRDAAGLGASRICLCGTELGEKSYMDSNIVERGAAYAALVDGTAQAKSTHVPELVMYPSVRACLKELFPEEAVSSEEEGAGGDLRVMLDNVKPVSSLYRFLEENRPEQKSMIYASIGSERGWTDNERQMFESQGFTACSMGERVLRTETAVTVALSLILQSLNVL